LAGGFGLGRQRPGKMLRHPTRVKGRERGREIHDYLK
jgi:hypothetical protein